MIDQVGKLNIAALFDPANLTFDATDNNGEPVDPYQVRSGVGGNGGKSGPNGDEGVAYSGGMINQFQG